jgi:hypothetical protein
LSGAVNLNEKEAQKNSLLVISETHVTAGTLLAVSDANAEAMNLLNIDNAKELCLPSAAIVISSPTKSSASPHCSPKDKINLCFKIFKLLRRNVILKCLLPVVFVILICMLLVAFKSSTKNVLIWLETQNLWTTFLIFMLLFTIVSFPFSVGYLVLIISCGYIFSLWKGFFVAVLGANLGVAIAHTTIKSMQKKLPIHR